MEERVIIGNSNVRILGAELLVGTLAGLTRLPSPGNHEDAVIEAEMRPARDWPLDVAEHDGVHCFGRPVYAVEVEPCARRVRLLLTMLPEGDDLYWFQRDLFGVLACMGGDLMLHGSSVATPDGGAWVFCGASGVGKSTICRMLVAQGLPAINDEVNWLFHDADGTLRIVNQPFWFGRAETPSLPVTRLHILRQGAKCAFQPPLPKSESFARLLAGHLSIDTQYGFLKERADALRRLVEGRTIEVLEFNLDTKALLDLLWTNTPPNDS